MTEFLPLDIRCNLIFQACHGVDRHPKRLNSKAAKNETQKKSLIGLQIMFRFKTTMTNVKRFMNEL